MSDDLTEMVSDVEGIELFLDEKDPRGYEFTGREYREWEDDIHQTALNEYIDD